VVPNLNPRGDYRKIDWKWRSLQLAYAHQTNSTHYRRSNLLWKGTVASMLKMKEKILLQRRMVSTQSWVAIAFLLGEGKGKEVRVAHAL
jgi:hypothetical protein